MYLLVAKNSHGQVVASVAVSDQPLAIGRTPDCGLVLPSTGVSRHHATAYLRPDGAVVITDEGSANGVMVDGQYIGGPTLVDHTNVMQISEFVLTLESYSGMVPPGAPPSGSEPMVQAASTAPMPQLEAEEEPEPEEFYTMLEEREGAAAALASTTLQLRGRGGPYDGTVFTLDKPLVTVGRNDEHDLTLDDPSVSRMHAQLRLSQTGDSFTVLDLRSSNGTFVNGQRVKRAECADHSVVRFGDLAFVVELKRVLPGVKVKAPKPKRRLYIAGGAVLALLIGVGVVAYVKRPKEPEVVRVSPEERLRQLQAEVQQFIDEGRAKIAKKEWTEAVTVLDKALAKDPLNSESKELRTKALAEQENEKVYEKGLEWFALGKKENLVRAKKTFAKIPKDSIYQREVRYKIKAIDAQLAEEYRIEGVSRCKARFWQECHEALCKFFGLLPDDQSVPGEGKLREQLQRVEKRLSRRRGFEACEAPRFLNPVQEVGAGADPDKILQQKYESPAIRAVLMLYLQGKVDMALKRLTALRKKRAMRPYASVMSEVDRQLLIIRGKYQEGYSALRERDVEAAQKHWDLVLAADAALVPIPAEGGIESFYRQEIAGSLGDLYFDLGDEQLKLGRLRQAYDYLSRGKKAAPRNTRVLNGLLTLEKKAEELVRKGRGQAAEGNVAGARETLTLARDIVAEGRPARQEAEKALAELGG